MNDYQYDVFFSYKRDELSDEWHAKVAHTLGFWLKKELDGREVSIFIDTEDIETGERWKRKIQDSLKKSRCLVAILSPDYFCSRWCLSEWQSFAAREKMLEELGIRAGTLIAPARYHDGEHFPEYAKDVQAVDFSSYSSTMPSFWESRDAYEFERDKLKAFSKRVAKMIRNSPDYREDFPVVVVDSKDISRRIPIPRIG